MSAPAEGPQTPGGPPQTKTRVEVSGNTMRVYLFLLKSGPSELREVQRGLGLSTPSLASYHLGKLASAGYVSQNQNGQYYALKESAGEIIDGFSRMGAFLVPQLFFFAVFFTPVLLYFSIMATRSTSFVPLLGAASISLLAVVWYETAKVWRRLGAT